MNTAPVHGITIAPERSVQLKQIMEAMGYGTMNQTLGELIHAFAYMHRLPVTLPGVEVHRAKDGVVLVLEGIKPLGLSREGALCLVQRIRERLDGSVSFGTMEPDHGFAVSKKGRGFKLNIWSDPENHPGGQARSYSLDVAAEIADMVEIAATPRQPQRTA